MQNTSLATVNDDALPAIPKSSHFVCNPSTFAEWMQLAEIYAKSSMVPKDFQGNVGNVYHVMQMGARLGIDPGFMLQNTYVINNRPAMFGDLALSIVRASGKLEYIKEGYRGTESAAKKEVGDDFAAVCEVKRHGQEAVTQTFSVADAKEAGYWGKTGPWTTAWKRMLKFRARGFALRDVFGDVLQGLSDGYEQRDIETMKVVSETKPAPQVTTQPTRTDALLSKMQTAKPITIEQVGLEPLNVEITVKDEQPTVSVSMLIEQAKRKGLNEDAFRMLVQNATGSTKLTKANISQVIDAINALPLPMISDDDLEKIAGNVPPPDMRALAVQANKCGMDFRDVSSLIGELGLSTPLTAEWYKILLGEIDARVAAAV